MAQSMKSKIRKLAGQYNIDGIIQTAVEVRNELVDEQSWNNLTSQEKLDWFLNQCKKYNLTTKQFSNQISVNELPCVGQHNGTKAYFCLFLPKELHEDGNRETEVHLEIGGAYIGNNNGGIWQTAPGLKGKEKQIAEVIRLHSLGE